MGKKTCYAGLSVLRYLFAFRNNLSNFEKVTEKSIHVDPDNPDNHNNYDHQGHHENHENHENHDNHKYLETHDDHDSHDDHELSLAILGVRDLTRSLKSTLFRIPGG